jgi:hypothetical protein
MQVLTSLILRSSKDAPKPRSDHLEIVGGEHRLAGQRRELDGMACAVAVVVVEQRAGRLVVDDVVVGIRRCRTDAKEGRVQRMQVNTAFCLLAQS